MQSGTTIHKQLDILLSKFINQTKPEEIKKLFETPICDQALVELAIKNRQKAAQIMQSMDALQAASQSNHSESI